MTLARPFNDRGSLHRSSVQQSIIDEYLTPRAFEVPMPGGQTVRAYEVGPPDVPLVMGIHGTPSTGIGHIVNYVLGAPLFCRLVAFDRQGYGGSTPHPGRKVRDIVPVVEAILDHLSAEKASVYGHSGGGMLALATAALLPNRTVRVACLAGNGPNFGAGGFDYADGPSPLMREEIIQARKGPQETREFYRRLAGMNADDIEEQLYSENDRRINRLLAPLREKITQLLLPVSPFSEEDAYVDDVQSWVSPWGFDLGKIVAPTRIFYGLDDLQVARQHCQWLRTQIQNAESEEFPYLGHNFNQLMPHVFAWLVRDQCS
ncbi:alpha/beta fold hydrolase [Rhizobium laguerreae]|uniref:alpha/beta fold hydrolase n=1 Tax=Rhizobium laguerreae TaxID=1076926 RepID=UPI001C910C01|nr:alpha/beta hydrolase [Rhizobium laguerreae]MBY3490103.1 alpha/beta hydrolase [Rhizobium laguerreae]